MKRPEEILKEWIRAVNEGDIEAILALYNEKADLIPTFSNRSLSHPLTIREYFERLGSREELSLALHEKTLAVQTIQNNLCVLYGIYCWRFAVDGELFSFEARFSYLIDITLQNPILHHHSSQIPRML